MLRLPVLSLCLVFAASTVTVALHMPFRRRANKVHSATVKFESTSAANGNKSLSLDNVQSLLYTTTLLVNGQPVQVDLDTGSSDLWIDTSGVSLDGFTDTKTPGSIQYLDTTIAEGPILLGNVSLGQFVVEKQAFISAPGSNATGGLDGGLLGVSAPSASTIAASLSKTNFKGNSFLDNVFALYPSEPNFMGFFLSRSETGATDGGTLSIAEVPEEFSGVLSSPSLPVLDPDNSQAWIVAVDGVMIGGKLVSGHPLTSGFGLPSGQTVADLDTGTTLALAPRFYIDAIYSSVKGAQFDKSSATYNIPCDSQIDISFVFAQQAFPIHPIDMTTVSTDSNGAAVCTGSFSVHDPTDTRNDFLLGDVFLRNVYALYDFGNFTTVGDSAPIMKLLSVTNSTQANEEFDSMNKARIAALTQSDSDAGKTRASSSLGSDPSSSVDFSGLKRNMYIIMGLLGGVIVMLVVLVFATSRSNKGYTAVATAISSFPPPAHYSRTAVDDKYTE